MEIFQFLELNARRIVALALLAVLVAVPTAALLLNGTTRYRAVATVRLAPFMPAGTSGGVQGEIEDGFTAAFGLASVRDATAQAAGVTTSDLKAHLQVAFPNAGTTAEVSYTGTAAKAPVVVRVAAVHALTFATQQEVDETGAVAEAADARARQAVSQFTAFAAARGDGAYDVSRQVLVQQQLALQAILSRSPGDAAASALLTSTRAQLAQVQADEPRFDELSSAVNDALAASQSAQRDLAAAQAATATAASGATVAVKEVVAVGRLKQGLEYGFGAGLAAVLLAVTVLAVAELRQHAPAVPWPDADGPDADGGAGPWPPPPGAARGWRQRAAAWRGVLEVGGTALLLPVALAASAGLLFLLSQHRSTLAVVLAAPLGLAAGILAFTRFELFLLSMIVVRASLDSFNISTRGSTVGVDPGLVIGAVFIVAAILWLAAQRRSGRWVRPSRVTWAMWAFTAACVISIPASVLPSESVVGASKVLAGALMFSVLEQHLGQHPERVRPLLVALFLSLPVPVGIGMYQWLTNHGNIQTAGVSRVTSTFVHPSTFALYLLIILPVALVLARYYTGRLRRLLIAVSAICSLLVLVTYTRGAWLAAIVVIAYLGIRVRRQLLYVMAGAIVVLLIAVPSVAGRLADLHAKPVAPGAPPPTNSLSWRVSYWKYLVPLANKNPVTGIGFETVERTTPELLAPHNGFVEAYVETGLVGLATFGWLCWELGAYLRKRRREARGEWERTLALGAVAVALGLFVQLFSENLLTQTFVFWYAAVAITFGLPAAPRLLRRRAHSRRDDQRALVPSA